jgi:hypothetical protein
MAARARSESSQRAWSAALRSSRMRSHHMDLKPDERRVSDVVSVTTVKRSLIDVAQGGDSSLLRSAVGDSLAQGLTT